MDVTYIVARDLPEAWWLCIRAALKNGRVYTIDRGSHQGGQRKEIELVMVKVKRPGIRPLIPTVPEGLPVPTDMDYVQKYMTYLMTSIKEGKELYTYGDDIEPQFPEVCRMYKEDGHNTNQACMSIGSRDSIWLKHSQCLRVIDTRIQDGRLHYIVYFRSWDLFGGFPVNLAAIQLMKEGMAEIIGVEDGELWAFSKGLHLYGHYWELGEAVTGVLGGL